MKARLYPLPEFTREVDRLKRKYSHIEDDLQNFYQEFLNNPILMADALPGFGRKLWKARVGSTDMQRGKSGGFRIIFHFDESRPETVHLLSIYPKSERKDLSPSEYIELFKKVRKPPV